jgi:LysM repeat protein
MKQFSLWLLVTIMGLTIAVFPVTASDVIPLPDPGVIPDMLGRMNALRERKGLPPYNLNPQLTAAAQDQANWLVETGIRGHYRPDGNRPSHRANAAGFQPDGWCCGENYYMSIDATPDMVWNFWLYSPSHYVNLTHSTFTDVGVGMATNGYRHSYVLVFGKPVNPNAVVVAAETPTPIVTAENLPAVQPSPVEAPPLAVENSAGSAAGSYIIQPGENLYRIAIRYNTTVPAIMAANRISDPTRIQSGTTLIIPNATTVIDAPAAPASVAVVATQTPPPTETTPPPVVEAQSQPTITATTPAQAGNTYIVREGDNLFRIALNHKTTFETLATLNNITDPTQIYPGQVLILPST